MKTLLKTLPAVVPAILLSATSYATTFSYEDLNANTGGGAGDLTDSYSTTYNDVTERFTFDVDFSANPTPVEGFWLVVNNGPNPKKADANELAIMYGDLATGVLSTYAYNGKNKANSITAPGLLIETGTFSSSADSFSIDLDASNINAWNTPDTAPDYTGIAFDETIGIWFHMATELTLTYNAAGDTITNFVPGKQGWIDTDNRSASVVPEPLSAVLLAMGLAGLGARRKLSA